MAIVEFFDPILLLSSATAKRAGHPVEFGPKFQNKGTMLPQRPPGAWVTLPAGTHVKHGTTSDVLPSILTHGLLPSGIGESSSVLRGFEPTPAATGCVYVAESAVAYSTALVAFSAKTVQVRVSGAGMPPKPDDVPVPVVLSIRLREDCVLTLDEDYLRCGQSCSRLAARAGDPRGRRRQPRSGASMAVGRSGARAASPLRGSSRWSAPMCRAPRAWRVRSPRCFTYRQCGAGLGCLHCRLRTRMTSN
jgi:hypothetical protein